MSRNCSNKALTGFNFILLAALSCPALFAQCNEVRVLATVRNNNQQVVSGLSSSNFAAKLNGKPAQINSVQQNLFAHRVVMLLDHSGSMTGSRWQIVQSAALDFAKHLPVNIPIAVVLFDEKIQILAPLGDRQQAIQTLRKLPTQSLPRSRTRLWDAIDTAATLFGTPRLGDSIYAITDGGENQSREDAGKTQDGLIRSSVRFFVLLIRSDRMLTPAEQRGALETREIADKTGGATAVFSLSQDAIDDSHAHISDQQLRAIPEYAVWLMQNMLEDYRIVITSNADLSSKVKLRLEAKTPNTRDKYRVLTTPVAKSCMVPK